MSKPLRIVIGIVGLVVIVLGIRQMKSGIDEMSGKTEKKPQEVGERVPVPAHNCSVRVPKGWEKKDAAQGGIMFTAPKSSGYVANFSIMSQPFADSLRAYADLNVNEVKTARPPQSLQATRPSPQSPARLRSRSPSATSSKRWIWIRRCISSTDRPAERSL